MRSLPIRSSQDFGQGEEILSSMGLRRRRGTWSARIPLERTPRSKKKRSSRGGPGRDEGEWEVDPHHLTLLKRGPKPDQGLEHPGPDRHAAEARPWHRSEDPAE